MFLRKTPWNFLIEIVSSIMTNAGNPPHFAFDMTIVLFTLALSNGIATGYKVFSRKQLSSQTSSRGVVPWFIMSSILQASLIHLVWR